MNNKNNIKLGILVYYNYSIQDLGPCTDQVGFVTKEHPNGNDYWVHWTGKGKDQNQTGWYSKNFLEPVFPDTE